MVESYGLFKCPYCPSVVAMRCYRADYERHVEKHKKEAEEESARTYELGSHTWKGEGEHDKDTDRH